MPRLLLGTFTLFNAALFIRRHRMINIRSIHFLRILSAFCCLTMSDYTSSPCVWHAHLHSPNGSQPEHFKPRYAPMSAAVSFPAIPQPHYPWSHSLGHQPVPYPFTPEPHLTYCNWSVPQNDLLVDAYELPARN